MAKREVKMLSGSLFKNMIIFALPLMLSNLLQVLFNISDIAIVGKFGSSNSLGAVGSTAILVVLFTGLLIGIGGGINVLCAKYIGANNKEKLAQCAHNAFLIILGFGLLILLVGVSCSRLFLKWLNTKPDLIDGATLYLTIYFLGMPGVALYNFGSATFSAMGQTKKPLIFLSIAGVCNIILNLFFVIVCKLDVAGVALASIISQYLSAFLINLPLFKRKHIIYISFKEMKINKASASEILKVGLPAGLQNVIFAIANLFVQVGINSFDTVMVNGNSAALNADNLLFDVLSAVDMSCASFIGQNYGANNKERVLKSYWVGMFYSFVVGGIIGSSYVFFGRQFLSIFTNDQAVIDAGMIRLKILGFAYAWSSFMDVSIAASRGLGKTIVPTIIVITGSCIFRIVWIYTIFAHFKTITSLYMLYLFSWGITGIAETICFFVNYKKTFHSKEVKLA